MTYEISTSIGITSVAAFTRHPALDEAAARLGGKFHTEEGYDFPASAEANVRAIVAQIAEAPARPVALSGNPTGWSKASRRRDDRRHPLGEATYAGAGFTEYEDTAFGGGKVQIWDES